MPNTSGAVARVCSLKAEKSRNTKCCDSAKGISVFKYADIVVVNKIWHFDNASHVTSIAGDIKSSSRL